jgi:transforming growth factor-beta-induced protein
MKTTTQQIVTSFACLAAAGALLLPASAADRSLTEFGGSENEKLRWQIVNDGVMGGRSKGQISITDSGTLQFSGKLSLENNGGFSSLRTRDLNLDLSDSSGLIMRVKGDGRSYQVRLGTDARYRGMEVSFMAEFSTKKGQWQEVSVPFSELAGTFRGRSLKNEVFNPAKVRRLGLLLADKKAGPFSLEVDWIRAIGGADGSSIVDTAVADGRFKTLAAALTKAELLGVLQGDGPLTVFAPTDEAFAKLPAGTVESLLEPENLGKLQAILKYHVSPGATSLAGALAGGSAPTAQGDSLTIAFQNGQVRVNDAAIVDADITCSNGVIHVIDSVLLPTLPEPSNDILGVAKKAGSFSTLIAAVEAAGLTEALQGDGPFTVLAPTNEAFAALPKGTVETLLKKENLGKLKEILTYHALSGSISAGDALNAKSAKTLNGQQVKFAIEDGQLKVNGATIRSTDIECENGTIHVIDAVLLPSEKCSQSKCSEVEASVNPKDLIEKAIARGVPVFNDGDHEQCATIYEGCLQILANDERIDSRMRKSLSKVLAQADATSCETQRAWTQRAWTYRGALDSLYAHLDRSSR